MLKGKVALEVCLKCGAIEAKRRPIRSKRESQHSNRNPQRMGADGGWKRPKRNWGTCKSLRRSHPNVLNAAVTALKKRAGTGGSIQSFLG